jgi:hypothetical protein
MRPDEGVRTPGVSKPAHRLYQRKRPLPSPQPSVNWISWIPLVFFVSAYVAHASFLVDTRLRYEAMTPVFFWDQAWAGLWHAGGFAREFSSLLLIIEAFSTGGAVLVTLIEAVLIVALSRAAFGPLASRGRSFLGWLPPCLWLILQSFYSAPVHEVTIGLVISLGLLAVCNALKAPGLRVLAFWLGALLSLWLAGAVSCVVLALLGGLTQWGRGATKAAVWSAASAFWVALVPFDTSVAGFWRQGSAAPLIAALQLSYVLVAAIWIYSIKRGRSSSSDEHPRLAASHLLPAFGIIGVALIVAFYAIEGQGKNGLRIKRSARLQDWPTLLETARHTKAIPPSGRVRSRGPATNIC